jgi:hypothetical protein
VANRPVREFSVTIGAERREIGEHEPKSRAGRTGLHGQRISGQPFSHTGRPGVDSLGQTL